MDSLSEDELISEEEEEDVEGVWGENDDEEGGEESDPYAAFEARAASASSLPSVDEGMGGGSAQPSGARASDGEDFQPSPHKFSKKRRASTSSTS
jgi:hypothetical protein